MGVIRSEVWPTDTSKGVKEIVIGCFFEDTVLGSIPLNNSTRHAVNKLQLGRLRSSILVS